MRYTLTLILALCLTPPEAQAQDTRATFDLRLLGLKLGEMQIVGRVARGHYTAASSFRSTGVAGALARARFTARSSGRAAPSGLAPRRYSEDVDTGRRQSSARMTYQGGTPRVIGGTLASETDRLDPKDERGTLDPMTALFSALRTQPRDGLCDLRATVFDGARRSGFAFTDRQAGAQGQITCSGTYRRLKGFSASELRRQTVFPFAITYAPRGGLMRAETMEMQSSYGKVTLSRQ